MRETFGAIGVAVAIAGVGGAAIAAAADGGHSMMEGGVPGSGGPIIQHPDVRPDSLHGEYAVSDGQGGSPLWS